jgi:hypothetical protein
MEGGLHSLTKCNAERHDRTAQSAPNGFRRIAWLLRALRDPGRISAGLEELPEALFQRFDLQRNSGVWVRESHCSPVQDCRGPGSNRNARSCNGEVVIMLVLLRRDKQEFALRHVRDLQVVQSTARCPIALDGTLRGRCEL